jgi:hypothetical protein
LSVETRVDETTVRNGEDSLLAGCGHMRLLAFVIAWTAAGCFDPTYPELLSCASGPCPPGQYCWTRDERCHREPEPTAIDASVMTDVTGQADASPVDATPTLPDAELPRPDAGGFVVTGGIRTLDPGPAGSGTLRVLEGAFERGARVCSGALCVTGGFVP